MAAVSKSSSTKCEPKILEQLPVELWTRVAAFIGQEGIVRCSSLNRSIHVSINELSSTLWYEHHLCRFGPLAPHENWQLRFIESGHNLQMGMRAKPPTIRETGYITGCVLDGDELATVKWTDEGSLVTWADLGKRETEERTFNSSIYSLSYENGVFATGSEVRGGSRELSIWRRGEKTAPRILPFKDPLQPKENIFCKIGHNRVLLSGFGPIGGSGLSLVDLETGKNILPFGRNNPAICGAVGTGIFMDANTVLACHTYATNIEDHRKLHVWDLRLGFNKPPAQTYFSQDTGRYFMRMTLNSQGHICASNHDLPIGVSQAHLTLWDPHTQKCTKIVKPKGDIGINSLTSMGGVIFSGSNNGVLRCWDSNLKLMGKWVLPNSEKTIVPLIEASPSICVFMTQETQSNVVRGWNFLKPVTLWHAAALPFEPIVKPGAAASTPALGNNAAATPKK